MTVAYILNEVDDIFTPQLGFRRNITVPVACSCVLRSSTRSESYISAVREKKKYHPNNW